MDPSRSLSLQSGMDRASLQLSLFIVLWRRAPCDTPHRQVINCRDIYKQLNKLTLVGVGQVRVSSGFSTATGWDSAGAWLRPTASSRRARGLGSVPALAHGVVVVGAPVTLCARHIDQLNATKDNAAIPEVLPALSAAIPGYCALWWGHPAFTVLIPGTLRRSQVVAGQPGMMPQSRPGTSMDCLQGFCPASHTHSSSAHCSASH